MIPFNNNTKQMYKDFDRELNVYGILYLAHTLPSEYTQVEYIETTGTQYFDTLLTPTDITKYEFDLSWEKANVNNSGSYAGAGYYPSATSGSAYYSPLIVAPSYNNDIRIGYHGTWISTNGKWYLHERHKVITTLIENKQMVELDGTTIYSSTYSNTRPQTTRTVPLFAYEYNSQRLTAYGWSGKIYYVKLYGNNDELIRHFIPCYRNSDNEVGLYDVINDVFYTNAGTGDFVVGNDISSTYYETFILNEENKCKVLGFNIYEKGDIYYTSLPYNTMTIDVDNENGYFTEFSQSSIISQLNSDCYGELYIKINNDKYYKIMTMNFDEISSSDYEKAKLSFKSCISKLKTLRLKDKEFSFIGSEKTGSDLKNWLKTNYNINLSLSNENLLRLHVPIGYGEKVENVEDVILNSLNFYTREDGQYSNLYTITTNYENNIVYKKHDNLYYNEIEQAVDTIERDLQLERPIIKRETTYQGVLYNKNSTFVYSEQNKTYNKSISGKLDESDYTMLLYEPEWALFTITPLDITISPNTIQVNIYTDQFEAYTGVGIKLTGNVGTDYVLNITNNNVPYLDVWTEETLNIGAITDTSKVLKLNKLFPVSESYYYNLLQYNSIRSKVELKCMGLPYLELGDYIEIENETETKTKIIITELDMNYDGGLTMRLKGYEYYEDNLFPADNLYPSNDLFPNTPI